MNKPKNIITQGQVSKFKLNGIKLELNKAENLSKSLNLVGVIHYHYPVT